MTPFTPWTSLAGGALIGLSATSLLYTHGRIAGVSGMLGSLLRRSEPYKALRAAFLLGLIAAGALMHFVLPSAFGAASTPRIVILLAGLLVGYGTQRGSGCTSGHGICGLSRGSVRSIAATITFMATGAATVFVMRHLLQGAA